MEALARAGRRSGRRGAARAFTLIEVVIALGLVLLLGGLALPTLIGLTSGASLSESESRVESVAAICRAEAMRRGQVIELAARENADGVTVLLGRRADSAPVSGAGDAPDGDGAASDPWPAFLVEELPRGCAVIEDVAERESTGRAEDGGRAGPGAEDGGSAAPRKEVLIAAFLPSGAAAVRGATKLRAKDGREASIGVNSWTGTVRVTPSAPKREEESGAARGAEENKSGPGTGEASER